MVKQISVLTSLCLVLGSASASAERSGFGTSGTFLLAGGLSVEYETLSVASSDISETFSLGITPEFGYFVVDDFYLGMTGSVRVSTTTYESGSDSSESTSYVIGLRPAYYISMSDGSMAFYIRGLLGYASTETGSSGTALSGYAVGLGLGGTFAFGAEDGGFIFLGMDYTHYALSNDAITDLTQADITFDVGVGAYF